MKPGEPRDLLKLLANPTNRAILTVLATEAQYPRRLAEVVGLTEDEASKRLRLFERAGLAEASWANVGKNVRLYKLAAARFTVSVDAGGLSVAGVAGDAPVKLSTVVEAPPSVERFVGRRDELDHVEGQLGERRAVCIVGIGGAGKSALAAAYAQRAGRPLLWHTVSQGESAFLLLNRIAANLQALEPGERGQRLAALRTPDEEDALLQNVTSILNDRGVLVVLDRFEAAGEGASEIAAGLARGMTRARLVLTARAFPAGVPRDLVAAYRLPGLGVVDCERLLAAYGSALAADTVQDVFDRTRGHPLSLVLVAQVSGRDPKAGAESLLQESGIRDFLVDDVLPQLPDAERTLLYAVSVLRHPFAADDADDLVDLRDPRHALLRLEGRGLVQRAGDEYHLHDLVRGIVADVAPGKKALHARAAKALAGSGVPMRVLEAAHHYLEAGAPKEAGAIVREEASRRPYRFFDMGLGTQYREVLQRVADDTTLPAGSRAAAEVELGVLETFGGDASRALQHLNTAAPTATHDEALRVPFLVARGRVHRLDGDLAAAADDFRQAAEAAGRARDPAHRLEAQLAWASMEEERDDDVAFAIYKEAIDAASQASDARNLSLAYAGASRIRMRQGDEAYRGWAEEALRLARLTGYLRGEVSVYMTLTTHAMVAGKTDTGLAYADRYIDIAGQLGDPWLQTCAFNDKALLLVAVKRYEEALALVDQGVRLAQSIRSGFFEFHGRLVQSEAYLGLGRNEEALRSLTEAFRQKFDAWPLLVARAWRNLATVHVRLGHPAEGRRAEAEARRWSAKATPGRAAQGAATPKRSRPATRGHGSKRP